MPNWCENSLKIKAKTKKEITDFLDKYGLKEGQGDQCGFDFDKIIPEPRTLEECPLDCVADENSHIQINEDRPWFNWYKWRNQYWGVKWNADNVILSVKGLEIFIDFLTPWCEPWKVIAALKNQNPNLKIRNWAEVEGF